MKRIKLEKLMLQNFKGCTERTVELSDRTREFDSCIIQKVLAGRIKPAFFVSNILFLCMLFYGIMWYNKG